MELLVKILAVEDVYGSLHEFRLTLSKEVWEDRTRLVEIAMNLIYQETRETPDITNIQVLTIN